MSDWIENDQQFEDHTIKTVSDCTDGWSMTFDDGWSFFAPASSLVEPKPGMLARLYGKGIGYTVRGLVLDGVTVFYRTEAEDKEKREIDLYGADAADWLARWDRGGTVWTIEMGGLGPGYEQCIHIACAEILRNMLAEKYNSEAWEDSDTWKRDRDKIEAYVFKNPTVEALGLAGAQWGAALNIASHLYMHGPRKVMSDERVKDRHIQVSNKFPVAA